MKKNNKHQLPVIIGSGLSGLAISYLLNKKKIRHILVGKPPLNSPKLGESINGEGTVDLSEYFSEFKQYFLPKRNLIFYNGNLVCNCDLNAARYLSIQIFCKLTGFSPFNKLLHIERVGFDKALFAKVKSGNYCTYINSTVTRVNYSEDLENITSISLRDTDTIYPSYVFDCTNQIGLLAKSMNIEMNNLDDDFEVVFTRYNHTGYTTLPNWGEATSILRLNKEIDKIDGTAWCIPLDSYISIGVKLDESQTTKNYSKEEVMKMVDEAYELRGLNYRKYYTLENEIFKVKTRNYIYQKVYGGNWVLSAGSAMQIWFTAGAGISVAMYVATLAHKFIKSPIAMGKKYHDYLQKYLPTHQVHNQINHSTPNDFSRTRFNALTDKMILSTFYRLSIYSPLRNSMIYLITSKLLKKLIELRIISTNTYCNIVESILKEQTKLIHNE